MKTRHIVPAVLILGFGTALASPHAMQEADTDGDGYITLSEFTAAQESRAAEHFSRLDENADGLLSEDELKSAHRERRGHDRRHRPEPGEIVASLDADNSGSLSQTELQGSRAAPDADAFLAADKDGNGELDAEELGDLLKSRHQRRPQN